MIIRNIEVSQFRNYSRCTIKLSPKINWIFGLNGQGKTNLVEAVFYLCNLDSFRTAKPSQLLQVKKSEAVIQAQVEQKKVLHLVRVNITKNGRQVYLDHRPSRRVSEYIFSFMALAFTPEDVNLFRSVPHERRKFFNRIMSFNDPLYFKNIQEYSKIVSHKNTLLRQGKVEQIAIWNEMLAKAAAHLMNLRIGYVNLVNKQLNNIFKDISGRSETLKLIYKPSLNLNDFEENKCLQQLEKSLSRELQYGFSLIGPHRDEYHLLMDGKRDRDVFSQGEFRITNLSLKLTINHILYESYQFSPVLIFDDLFSELDDEVINHVLKYFLKLKNQIFITSTSEPFGSLKSKNFHVVKGELV